MLIAPHVPGDHESTLPRLWSSGGMVASHTGSHRLALLHHPGLPQISVLWRRQSLALRASTMHSRPAIRFMQCELELSCTIVFSSSNRAYSPTSSGPGTFDVRKLPYFPRCKSALRVIRDVLRLCQRTSTNCGSTYLITRARLSTGPSSCALLLRKSSLNILW